LDQYISVFGNAIVEHLQIQLDEISSSFQRNYHTAKSYSMEVFMRKKGIPFYEGCQLTPIPASAQFMAVEHPSSFLREKKTHFSLAVNTRESSASYSKGMFY
jgi:hypothetical protein